MIGIAEPEYAPVKLINHIISKFKLKNDSALAERLGVSRALVSAVLRSKTPLGPKLILQIHHTFGMQIREIKLIAGVPCLPSRRC